MIQTVAVTSLRMSLNLFWTFKFASMPPQILSGYIIVAHFLLQSWWHLMEPFFFGGFCRVLQFPCVGPLRWEQVLSSCVVSSLLSCASPSCQMALLVGFHTASAGLVSVSCLRKHLFQETSVSILVGMVESLTSLSRSWIKQYSNNLHCPLAQPFRALCHHSLLLFILMAYF